MPAVRSWGNLSLTAQKQWWKIDTTKQAALVFTESPSCRAEDYVVSTVDETLAQAKAHHNAGELNQAAQLYQQVSARMRKTSRPTFSWA